MTRLKFQSLRWLFLTALLFCVFSSALQAKDNKLTPEMIVNMKHVTQVAIDPSGQKIAFVLNVPRTEEDKHGKSYSEIWLTTVDGKKPKQYISKPGRPSSVSWSPDGKWITFLSKKTKEKDKKNGKTEHTQIYKIAVTGGESSTLTKHNSSISRYHWSPDGKSIAFVAADPETKEEKEAQKAGRDWKVYDENYKHLRLWILDIASGKTRQLFEEDLSVWNFVWTPDSKQIIFQAAETPLIDDSYVFQKIYTTPISAGTPEVLCNTKGKLGSMAVSPDGKKLAFLGAISLNDPLAQSLFTVPIDGEIVRFLSQNVASSGTWVDWINNKTLALLSVKGTQTVLSKVNAENGKMTDIIAGGPIMQSIDLNSKTGRFAAVAHAHRHPREVFSGKIAGDKIKRLTNHNPWMKSKRIARQEVTEWLGADGWRIEGVLTYPLYYKAGQKYPLVLQIHGGPEGVSLNGWTTSAGYPVQVLAGEGYFVLQPNYRGSGGRGVDFSKADHDDLGGKEFEDVLAGVDTLIERGFVDGERVGTGGWSYGGYFSAWAATRHSERFKASVVAAGISNWISFAGTTDIPHEMSLVHWNSYWHTQRDLHWERSPQYYIEKADTPTLVIHGMSDTRVHPEQGIQLYTALKIKRVPTKLVLYPRQPHGLVERAHQLDYMKRVVEWFNKYLQVGGTN